MAELFNDVALFIVLIAFSISLILFVRSYGNFYRYMKSHFPVDLEKMNSEDFFYREIGPWFRWPAGPTTPFINIILKKYNSDDRSVNNLMHIVRKRFYIFLTACLILLVFSVIKIKYMA